MSRSPYVRLIGFALALWVTASVIGARALLHGQGVASFSADVSADAPSLGAIPDRPVVGCDATTGTPRNVTFTVTGVASGVPSDVHVAMSFGSPAHTWAGDIEATLIAPNGASSTIFGRTGATTATSCGDSSDLSGTYVFRDDAAAPPSGGWWQAANVADVGTPILPGTYRATQLGGAGTPNPAPATLMTPSFASVTNVNGTWTLRLTDHANGDTGAITGATLSLSVGSLTAAPFDYDGDHKSDATVVRSGGGSLTWYMRRSSDLGLTAIPWGLSTDQPVGGDFDGDGKTDVTVWRSGSPAVFYARQSSNGALFGQQWGLPNDNPKVIGDYDGDGKDDLAVLRCPASAGQCYYYVRRSSDGSLLGVPWGFGTNATVRPSPGDFDGDGKADIGVRMPDPGAGTANIFYLQQSAAGFAAVQWGLPTDFSLRGDYDGDGKDDLAVVRFVGPGYTFYVRRSSDLSMLAVPWGTGGDIGCVGDYDGDGRADLCVFRAAGTPSFYIRKSVDGTLLVIPWGTASDLPPSVSWIF